MAHDHRHEHGASGSHDHSSHSHDHAHAHHATGRAFAVGLGLNATFVVVELLAGVLGNSVALVADAAHNFSDVLGLALAWGATRLAQRPSSARRTYGLRRSTILASLANAVLLLVGVGGVSWEAVGRFRGAEAAPHGKLMLIVAAIGVAINGGSALLFLRGKKDDANIRGAFLHLVADAAVSVGVVVAGGVLLLTGWKWIDPVVSLVISVVILGGTWSLLRDALNLALDAVPSTIDPEKVRRYLETLPDVRGVHDLHIWAMSTTENVLTAHLVVDAMPAGPLACEIDAKVRENFKIHHVTLQLDPPEAQCTLAGENAC